MLKIIDMPMGTGKTTGIINYMNENKDNKYMFITPFLDEVERIKNNCIELDFKEPSGKYSKLSDLKSLIADGENIVSTHALFSIIDSDIINLLQMSNYILILDEVLEIIEPLNISPSDIHMLIKDNIIYIDENNRVYSNNVTYKGRFNRELNSIKNQNVYLINDTLLLCVFNFNVFDCFEDIFILTYLFDGSIMKSYFDIYNLKYGYYNISNNEILIGKYDDLSFRTKAKELINIYEGKLNNIGIKETVMSSNWYKSRKKKDEHRMLKNNMYNYFRNIIKSNSEYAMWSTLSGTRNIIRDYFRPKSFGNTCFVSCNARATNNYSNKRDLIYAVNVYINPFILEYFNRNYVKLDEDKYALSQMLQWIWRSAIRKGETINIYIPSKRMRNLLKQYLNMEIEKERQIVFKNNT